MSYLLVYTVFLLLIFSLYFVKVIQAGGCKNMDFKETLKEQTLANHVFKTVPATNEGHCQSLCFLQDRCISYSYGTSAGGQKYMCELSDSDHLMHPEDVVRRPGVIYRSAQNTCACRANQTCRFDFIRNTGVCVCPPGFTGSACETNIDECSCNLCQNGGACVDLVSGYRCACSAGYTGDNCQSNINECNSQPCLNGGRCEDGINAFTCTCSQGYTGATCQIDIKRYCIQVPDACSGGATCNSLDSSPYYICSCPSSQQYDSTKKQCIEIVNGKSDD